MSHKKSSLDELISTLKQRRDELALKIHLGNAELKREWEETTGKLDDLTRKYDSTKHAVEESAQNLSTSLQLVAEEIKNSFDRIRKGL